jgi:hypothetical protein
MTHGNLPVAHAEVQAQEQEGKTSAQFATTAADGSYRLRDLPPGTYIVKISATGFYSAEIRNVEVDGRAAKLLPAIRVEFGLIADCGIERRPNYYRLLIGSPGTGAVGDAVSMAGDARIPGGVSSRAAASVQPSQRTVAAGVERGGLDHLDCDAGRQGTGNEPASSR